MNFKTSESEAVNLHSCVNYLCTGLAGKASIVSVASVCVSVCLSVRTKTENLLPEIDVR